MNLNSDSSTGSLSRVTTPETVPEALSPGGPRSARGTRTRDALVAAARHVFERDGYLDARIVDIAAQARVATGSFYTHFDSKQAIFAAVMAEVHEETLHPRLEAAVPPDDPVAVIEAANRAYLEAYRRNAKLMGLMEQVALIDDDFRRLRLDRARAFAQRNARSIRRLQHEGKADPGLDPLLAAHAINAMVSRMANMVFVHGARIPFDSLVETVTRLWANALRIPVGER
jgi:AcrR family transcriptional regulator